MSSMDHNQLPQQVWNTQHLARKPVPQADNRYSQSYAATRPYYAELEAQSQAQPAPYLQPHYATTAPTTFIAELPAPLPPAPHTITSGEQLKEDALLAHKLQQIEVAEVRQRSSSAVSQNQRPISMLPPNQRPVSMLPQNPPYQSPLLHQVSSLSLTTQSTNMSSADLYWGPDSFNAARDGPTTNPLLDVVPPNLPIFYDSANDFPIPVQSEEQSKGLPVTTLPDTHTLIAQLEENRQVPYPPTWRLPPTVATFYAYPGDQTTPGSDWLTQQESCTWRTIRPTETTYNPAAPTYAFKFTTKGGSFRDPRFSWAMTLPDPPADPKKKKASKGKPVTWSYDLRLEKNTGMRKSEVLNHGAKKSILTTYVHAQNYDSLRFVGPDGRGYMWVSSSAVSSMTGFRYDTLRHALFVSVGDIQDPLYGEIIADHTFWDGYVDEHEVHTGVKCDGCQTAPIKGPRWKCKTCHHHDVCKDCRDSIQAGRFGEAMQKACDLSLVCLPDEALCIRSAMVEPALVIASLQILKDWERHTLRGEKKKNPKAFLENEEEARKRDLGIMRYWRATDWDKKEKKNTANEKMGTVVKARSTQEAREGSASALGGLIDASFSLASHGTSHSGGGGDGGGSAGGSS
ncbi:hypothetical protein DE146DRAFT_662827 [Phaeosphaeria sp. MPI-PUGE-AT-0046c]|nr:hypothetical protein DE146DRAFT_662827 [Phaeosphaeria sp. MPI-PUGE-AT-0046c]